MSQIPIPMASEDEREQIIRLVDICLTGSESLVSEAVKQLDNLVENLYGIKAV